MNARDVAKGRWPAILAALGIDASLLNRRHHPCPNGEGRDRFRFSDRNGDGNYFCACSDGSKSGFDLLMCVKGWTFAQACAEVERVAGTAKAVCEPPRRDPRPALRRIAKLCAPAGFGVRRYLRNRGLETPATLREANLVYWDGDIKRGPFRTMVALIHGADGSPQSYHLTYLDGVAKADVPAPRKVMTPVDTITGGAIRLYSPAEHMGIAEGIETAIAARMLHGVPVWAAVSANGIESFVPPEICKRLTVFADNDESFTGQAAAYALAKRLNRNGIVCDVAVPERGDWNDELLVQRGAA